MVKYTISHKEWCVAETVQWGGQGLTFPQEEVTGLGLEVPPLESSSARPQVLDNIKLMQ